MKDGDILSDGQRQEMIRLAEAYSGAQKKYVDEYVFPPLKASYDLLDPSNAPLTYKAAFGDYVDSNKPDEEKSFWSVGNVNNVEQTSELQNAKAFFAKVAQASLDAGDGIWSKEELAKINDPNTTLEDLSAWNNTWNKYNATEVTGDF